jgi:hypothetical protein
LKRSAGDCNHESPDAENPEPGDTPEVIRDWAYTRQTGDTPEQVEAYLAIPGEHAGQGR